MATDTDATAARLRLELHVARHAMERAYAAYGASDGLYDELVRLNAAMDAADKAYAAALDTLIQYHRDCAMSAAFDAAADCFGHDEGWPAACQRLEGLQEAAQARLAAYEEER